VAYFFFFFFLAFFAFFRFIFREAAATMSASRLIRRLSTSNCREVSANNQGLLRSAIYLVVEKHRVSDARCRV
jgi:hypothetical protein